jgi:hypothetical protein
MGKNGDTTISALQGATGIVSPNLVSFAPSGYDTSNGVYVSDFLIRKIGRDEGLNGFKTDLERIGSGALAQGVDGHNTFKVGLDVEPVLSTFNPTPSELWVEQIGVSGSALDVISPQADATLLEKSKVSTTRMTLEFEVAGVNSVRVEVTLNTDLNSDATNAGVPLVYDSANDSDTDVWSDAPRTWQMEWSTSGSDMAFTAYPYDPNNQIDDFWRWDADPNESLGSPNGTTDGNNNDQMVIAQFDYTQYYSDGETFTMQVIYEDQSGNAQDTIAFDVDAGSDGVQLFNGLS